MKNGCVSGDFRASGTWAGAVPIALLYYLLLSIISSYLYFIYLMFLFLFLFLFYTSFIGFFDVIGAGVRGFAIAIPLNLCKNGIIMLKKHSKLLIITHARIFIKF